MTNRACMLQKTYRQELISCCELVVVVLCTQALQDRSHVDTMRHTAALSIGNPAAGAMLSVNLRSMLMLRPQPRRTAARARGMLHSTRQDVPAACVRCWLTVRPVLRSGAAAAWPACPQPLQPGCAAGPAGTPAHGSESIRRAGGQAAVRSAATTKCASAQGLLQLTGLSAPGMSPCVGCMPS